MSKPPEIIATFVRHSFGSPSQSDKKKEITGIRVGKEVKLSLFADHMIVHTENPKGTIRNLLGLINDSMKLQDTNVIHRNK